MIKIQITDVNKFRADYLDIVYPLILNDLNNLKTSLGHLNDYNTIQDDEIVKVKTLTKRIVDSIVIPKTTNGAFNKKIYKNKVSTYRADADSYHTIDWQPLISLTNHLLDEQNEVLNNLITGDPSDLKTTHDNLYAQFGITNTFAKNIMSNAFSYDTHGSLVRDFFHDLNITSFCPYCNIARARHSKNATTGKVVNQFHLDHFFSQVDHPMLGLSLFNLVPSDSVCNVDNKSRKLFSNEFHLNPYISGFGRDMIFQPELNELGEKLLKLDLAIQVDRNSERWKQLIGDADEIDQAPDHGNINVFQLFGKYNDADVLSQMEELIKSYVNVARNERAIRDILNDIEDTKEHTYQNFKSWYENITRTKFHENEFGKHAYSKLHRDLLDYVYKIYNYDFHEDILDILESSYSNSTRE